MKRIKKTACIILSLIMIFTFTPITQAHAATEYVTMVKAAWTRVYPAPSNTTTKPINGWVRIEAQNSGATHLDIRMMGKNGNEIWSECCAVDYNEIRSFWCGEDVYSIEAKSHWSGINITNKNVTVIATKQ